MEHFSFQPNQQPGFSLLFLESQNHQEQVFHYKQKKRNKQSQAVSLQFVNVIYMYIPLRLCYTLVSISEKQSKNVHDFFIRHIFPFYPEILTKIISIFFYSYSQWINQKSFIHLAIHVKINNKGGISKENSQDYYILENEYCIHGYFHPV